MKTKREGREVKGLIQCPMCKSMSYPAKGTNEKNEPVEYCKSCGENMTQYFEAIKEFEEKYREQHKEEIEAKVEELKNVTKEPVNA
jgi:DNA-directed RNA polymerase subunit M/transcription elongation factor TFIIS